MKHQECKFGCTCTKHHPQLNPGINLVAKARPFNATKGAGKGVPAFQQQAPVAAAGNFPRRPNSTPCAFFLKTGSCKFGDTCKFDHPGAAAQPAPPRFNATFNTTNPIAARIQNPQHTRGATADDGIHPIRPGQQLCSYYAKTGECKFGSTCKWDHSSGPAGNVGRQAEFSGEAEGVNSLGYPLRPGAAPCAFFAKTGNCSYGGSCKWDHPEEFCQPGGQSAQAAAPGKPRQALATPHGTPQSTGLPTRPGVQACVFYLKMGTCSFGATCKWDHPLGQGASGGADSGPQRTNGFTARATPY